MAANPATILQLMPPPTDSVLPTLFLHPKSAFSSVTSNRTQPKERKEKSFPSTPQADMEGFAKQSISVYSTLHHDTSSLAPTLQSVFNRVGLGSWQAFLSKQKKRFWGFVSFFPLSVTGFHLMETEVATWMEDILFHPYTLRSGSSLSECTQHSYKWDRF